MNSMHFNTLDSKYSEITPEIEALAEICLANEKIDQELYTKYKVNRGLRDLEGNGVLTGLTEISDIQSFDTSSGEKIPCEGKLYFRGINVYDLVDGFINEKGAVLKKQPTCSCSANCPIKKSLMILTNY